MIGRATRIVRVLRYRGMLYPLDILLRVAWPHVIYSSIYHRGVFDGWKGQMIRSFVLIIGGVLGGMLVAGWKGLWFGPVMMLAVVLFRPVREVTRFRRAIASSPSTANGGHHGTAFVSSRDVKKLGRFDDDGRFLGLSEETSGLFKITAEDFVRRRRFDLQLFAQDGGLVVLKTYRGNRAAFLREVEALNRLGGDVNAPVIVGVRSEGPVLERSFVPGKTVRDLLVEAGANILSKHTREDPALQDLSPAQRVEAVWARGREVFDSALPPGFLRVLERQLDRIHRIGVTGFSLTFGNVVVHEETGEPWFIDFDNAVVHRSTRSMAFRRARDRDRELFNKIWGTKIMTEAEAARTLRRIGRSYAPIDLGDGLVTRGFWTPDSGTGRWAVLNGRVVGPLVGGKRVLDLGTNNAVMPMMMFREGASKIVALERDPEYFAIAKDVHRLFEWRDMERYDFDLRQADMRAVCHEDFGTFDVVTAFCSLYYLSEEDMARVTRRVAEIAPIFVVQAKTDTRFKAAEEKARKSSVRFLEGILRENGFSSVELKGRSGYSRPLLIAVRS